MKYRQLGATDLTVSEIGFPICTIDARSNELLDKSLMVRIIQEAHEAGVTLFDTTGVCQQTTGEEILDKALLHKRHDLVIATSFHCGVPDHQKVGLESFSQTIVDAHSVRSICEQTLRRLRTDYLDLYQLQNPTVGTLCDEELLPTLMDLIKEGKVRYLGLTFDTRSDELEPDQIIPSINQIASLQMTHGILCPQSLQDHLDYAKSRNIGILGKNPLAYGMLRGDSEADHSFLYEANHTASEEWLGEAVQTRERLLNFGRDIGKTLVQIALQFALATSQVASLLPNISSIEQLRDYTHANDGAQMTEADLSELRCLSI